MNKRLITLNGYQMEGDVDYLCGIDITKKDDVAAGLIFWNAIARAYPGITWGDVYETGMGAKWWQRAGRAIGRGASDFVSKAGKTLGSVVDKTGEKAGETIRLFSDKKVQDAVSRGVAAYSTGGASEAVKKFLPGLSKLLPKNENPVVTGGDAFKTQNKIDKSAFKLDVTDPKVMAIGAGGLILVVLLMSAGRRN